MCGTLVLINHDQDQVWESKEPKKEKWKQKEIDKGDLGFIKKFYYHMCFSTTSCFICFYCLIVWATLGKAKQCLRQGLGSNWIKETKIKLKGKWKRWSRAWTPKLSLTPLWHHSIILFLCKLLWNFNYPWRSYLVQTWPTYLFSKFTSKCSRIIPKLGMSKQRTTWPFQIYIPNPLPSANQMYH